MCGIVGYVGGSRSIEVLMEGLQRLEYRGYDSAGLAVQPGEGRLEVLRRVGPLRELERAVAEKNGGFGEVLAGIGHTRWATHGRPSEENAHPHVGGDGRVAVVHNGIVENHAELRKGLERRGVGFRSETDTEVIAHLLAERLEGGASLAEAFGEVMEMLEGAFAVAAISADEPGTVVAGRRQSPLVVGLGEGENFLASGVPALLGFTHRFVLVENDEMAVVTRSSVELRRFGGEPVEREPFEVDWDPEAVELGGFPDYMSKEIHEQPQAIRATLDGRLGEDGMVDLSEVGIDLSGVERVVVVACGTAYHAGLLGKYFIERYARVPVEVAVASEYRYSDPVGDPGTLVVAISQSGETTDTLAAVDAAKGCGARVLAITNTRGSLITREADGVLLTRTGPEICVAATKTFVAQVVALELLAMELGRSRETLAEERLRELVGELRLAPERVQEAIESVSGRLDEASALFEEARCSLFLGRGVAYPVALEGALKLKEISYLPAEGYPAGEMKHGPIALIDERCPVVALFGSGIHREKTLSNVQETVARGARVVAVAFPDDEEASGVASVVLPVPRVPETIVPLVLTVPLQMLAHEVATDRGLDVDKPRNLAKSVTVE
ncbi:MAG: glutamine--fructose-6-phosphate transaminase (isomerizing) [Rubrobacteraceae bacterium]|nr:glutamine--fructose-6-phosphate transaminase (isomerizing) [Rubrobacteraceae bacterium]